MRILSEINLPAKLENLPEFLQVISSCAKEQGLDSRGIIRIEMATEEILVNIFNYAYPNNMGYAYMSVGLEDDNGFVIRFEDTGIPFNPLSAGKPDTTASISERKIGGLGVCLVRKIMDDVQYRREGERNILTVRIFISG